MKKENRYILISDGHMDFQLIKTRENDEAIKELCKKRRAEEEDGYSSNIEHLLKTDKNAKVLFDTLIDSYYDDFLEESGIAREDVVYFEY